MRDSALHFTIQTTQIVGGLLVHISGILFILALLTRFVLLFIWKKNRNYLWFKRLGYWSNLVMWISWMVALMGCLIWSSMRH